MKNKFNRVPFISFPKTPDYQVDMVRLKLEGKVLETVQKIMLDNYPTMLVNGFDMYVIENFKSVCLSKLNEMSATFPELKDFNVEEIFNLLSFKLSTEGYNPSWYLVPTQELAEVSKVFEMEPIVRHLNHFKNSGVIAEVAHLTAEMKMLKDNGTSAQALEKWKTRIAKLKSSPDYKERNKKVKELQKALETTCVSYGIPVPVI